MNGVDGDIWGLYIKLKLKQNRVKSVFRCYYTHRSEVAQPIDCEL